MLRWVKIDYETKGQMDSIGDTFGIARQCTIQSTLSPE